MLVHQAFRYEVDPNNRTRSGFASHHGAKRVAYNWGRDRISDQLEAGAVLTVLALRQGATKEEAQTWARELTGPVPWTLPALRKEWNTVKDEVAPWWKENSKEAYSSGLDAVARGFKAFFDSRSGKRAGPVVGFPKRKTRRGKQRCRFTTGPLGVVDNRHVRLPRLGIVRTKEPTTKLLELVDAGRARVLSATSAEEAGRLYVSFTCEVERNDPVASTPGAVVGVDWGIQHLATLSTGDVVENPRPLTRYERRMRTTQRELSRRQPGSKRHRRTKRKLARVHRLVANTRRDAICKLTTKLATTYGTVVVENLNVKGMSASPAPVEDGDGCYLQNGTSAKAGLNRSVLDACPGEVRRQLAYKLTWHGGALVVAPRFFPSTKTCSGCGETRAKLSLSERTYSCEQCGLVIDRDLNAALNLAAYGRRVVAVSGTETQNARGGGHPRPRPKPPVKREDGSGQPGRTVTSSSQGEAA